MAICSASRTAFQSNAVVLTAEGLISRNQVTTETEPGDSLDCGKAFSPLTGTVFDAHKILIETFGLTEEVYTTKATHNLSDDDNPMEPINAIHRSLKRFMRQHHAYDRDDLQEWLNLFWFIYTNLGISLDDKVKEFLRMAVLTRKVIRFREGFAKKTDK